MYHGRTVAVPSGRPIASVRAQVGVRGVTLKMTGDGGSGGGGGGGGGGGSRGGVL